MLHIARVIVLQAKYNLYIEEKLLKILSSNIVQVQHTVEKKTHLYILYFMASH